MGRGVAMEVLGVLACGISIQNEGQSPVSTGETWDNIHTLCMSAHLLAVGKQLLD